MSFACTTAQPPSACQHQRPHPAVLSPVAVAHSTTGLLLECRPHPLHVLAQTGKEHPLEGMGPPGVLLAAAASACLHKSSAEVLIRYIVGAATSLTDSNTA